MRVWFVVLFCVAETLSCSRSTTGIYKCYTKMEVDGAMSYCRCVVSGGTWWWFSDLFLAGYHGC